MLDFREQEINCPGKPGLPISPGYRAADIKDAAASVFGHSVSEIESPSRQVSIVRARQAACYAIREIMGWSLQRIAGVMGDRDHSTIRNACQRAHRLSGDCDIFRGKLDELFERFGKEVPGV